MRKKQKVLQQTAWHLVNAQTGKVGPEPQTSGYPTSGDLGF